MAGINTKILFYLIFYEYFWRLYLRTIFEITLILVLPTMESTFQLSDIFYNTVGGVLGGLMYCGTMKARKRL